MAKQEHYRILGEQAGIPQAQPKGPRSNMDTSDIDGAQPRSKIGRKSQRLSSAGSHVMSMPTQNYVPVTKANGNDSRAMNDIFNMGVSY